MLLNRERALEQMERHNLDALVAARSENVLYLTDCEGHLTLGLFGQPSEFYPSYFAVLPRRTDIPPTFICPASIFGYLVDYPTWVPDVRMWGDAPPRIPLPEHLKGDAREYASLLRRGQERGLPGPAQMALVKALHDMGLANGRLGVDDPILISCLKSAELNNAVLVEAYELFRVVRAVKTPEEVQRLRASNDNNEKALQALLDATRPGVRWWDLKMTYETTMLRLGSVPRFWGSCSGPYPYRFASFQTDSPAMQQAVKRGDVMRLDLGGTYKHYWADTGKTVSVGVGIAEWYLRAAKALREAREAYRQLLRPGTRMGDVVAAYERVVWEHGFTEFRAAWGHGLGLQAYDFPTPRIQRDTEAVLEENMVMNLEGGPILFGQGGISLENTYLITRSGFECWSSWDGHPFIVGQ